MTISLMRHKTNAGPSGGPQTPPEPERKKKKFKPSPSRRRHFTATLTTLLATARARHSPCHSFLAGQVGRQARHAPSLPQLYSGADARVSLCRYDDPRHSEQRTVSITINTKKDDAFLEAAKCRRGSPHQTPPTHSPTTHAPSLPTYPRLIEMARAVRGPCPLSRRASK